MFLVLSICCFSTNIYDAPNLVAFLVPSSPLFYHTGARSFQLNTTGSINTALVDGSLSDTIVSHGLYGIYIYIYF